MKRPMISAIAVGVLLVVATTMLVVAIAFD